MKPPLLEMRGIARSFGGVRANDGIDLTVQPGQILGLLGENGSGKSTLMKVLFGMIPPDAGSIVFRGRELSGHRPRQAAAAGLAMIHQHFMLVDAMTVAENVMLGWPAAGSVLRRSAVAAQVREASRRYGLDLDPTMQVGALPLGRRQRVEILKAILREAELLILDEPTSNLAPAEVAGLLGVLRALRAAGKGIVFITHKLPEVMEVCDAVVVLRAGRVAGRIAVADTDRAALAELMVGSGMAAPGLPTPATPGAARLVLQEVRGAGLDGIDLELRGGEILGLAGVDGNGQQALCETIAGMRRLQGGRILLDGCDVSAASVAARVAAGLAYMPADRAHTALVGGMSVAENCMLRDSSRAPYARRGVLQAAARRRRAQALMAAHDIRAPGPQSPAGLLSGGNQQKIVVARELDRAPAVLVAHQATWGLDPAATRFVLDRMLALRAAGAAVLYLSSELEEVLALGDRVAVLSAGRLAGVVDRAGVDLPQLGLWMAA